MTASHSDSPAHSNLVEVSRLLRESFRQRAQHLNLTQPQYRLLLALLRAPGINQARLAAQLEVNPVTVTQSVDRLVKAGWLRREPHPQDRRAVCLFLTEQAEPIMAELNKIAEETRAVAFRDFSDAEREQLESMLLRVKANLCAEAAAEESA